MESEELKELEKALENAGWFYKKIERQIAKLKEENKKRLENALFESEKALMSEDYYIQKSRLYTLEEKRENYAEMVEVRVEDFIKKVPFVLL